MPEAATLEDVLKLARQLSPLDKLKVIEQLAPELESALADDDQEVKDIAALEAQYKRGYEKNPEDPSDAEALLPHLPLQSEPW